MNGRILKAPPQGWDAYCEGQRSLLQSSAWHQVLVSGFQADVSYLVDGEGTPVSSIVKFRAGPFRIGYTAFPSGRSFRAAPRLPARVLAALGQSASRLDVDVLRLTVSGFDPDAAAAKSLGLPFHALPETAIADLGRWHEDDLPSPVRRNLRKAKREGVRIRGAEQTDADAVWKLYCGMIDQHGGIRRYTEAYFQALIALAYRSSLLRVRLAEHEGRVVAYFVTALEGDEGIYLHGGLDRAKAKLRPSELMYLDAISWARQMGCSRFSFLSSPADQPELVRFKEKWGGETREECVFSLYVRPLRAKAFEQSLKAYRVVKRLLR